MSILPAGDINEKNHSQTLSYEILLFIYKKLFYLFSICDTILMLVGVWS